jgi:hypothetical protein
MVLAWREGVATLDVLLFLSSALQKYLGISANVMLLGRTWN